jgi:hypothetical protein
MGLYDKLKVSDLHAMLKSRSISYPNKSRKSSLIDLLKSDDLKCAVAVKCDDVVMSVDAVLEAGHDEIEGQAPAVTTTNNDTVTNNTFTTKPAPHSSYLPSNLHTVGTFISQSSRPITQGRNVSGRKWKLVPEKRSSAMVTKIAANNRSTTWEKKMLQRAKAKAVKELEMEMKDAKASEKRDKIVRKEEQEKRRQENEYKAMQLQTMNTAHLGNKMKAMSKKQLRMVKKTRMNSKTGVVELVGAFEK